MALTYAIDFGTSNSLLGAADENQIFPPIALDPLASDPSVMRTLLYFPSQAKVFYGGQALKSYQDNYGEGRLIRSIKKHLPIRSFIGTYIEDRPFNLEDLIGLFLAEMRKRANTHFQQDVTRVVLGRPARFALEDADDTYAQSRLEMAARKAGFKTIEFLPEPVAAAVEFRQSLKQEKIVLVADFGGGTSDYTVMRMRTGHYDPNDVLSIGGIPKAGDVLDGAVMREKLSPYFGSDVAFKVPFGSNLLKMPTHLMERLCSPADISILMKRDVLEYLKNVEKWASAPEHKKKMANLFTLIEDSLGFSIFESIETAKKTLSNQSETNISYHYPGIDIEESILRDQFDSYVSTPVGQIINCLDETVSKAGLNHSQIDLVCCTGGTARVPYIREALEKRFGKEKLIHHKHFHSVVEGLAERAQELARKE